MLDFIYSHSNYSLFVAVCLIATIPSLAITYLIRRFKLLVLRESYGDAIAGLSAAIGIIYAVLAGFAALHGVENLKKADDCVDQEAQIIVSIYHDAKTFDQEERLAVKKELVNYITTAINVEWPLMRNGKSVAFDKEREPISNLLHILQNIEPKNYVQKLAIRSMYSDIESLDNVHLQRIFTSESSISKDLWLPLIVSSILTLASCFVFKLNLRLHLVLITFVSVTVSSMFFLLLALDHPFRGEFSVTPEALQSVLVGVLQS